MVIMQIAGKPVRVKLKADLTRYDARLKIGELGWTIPNVKLGIYGSMDSVVAVKSNLFCWYIYCYIFRNIGILFLLQIR